MILEGNSELHRKMKIAGDGKYLCKYKLCFIYLFKIYFIVYRKNNPSWKIKKMRKIVNIVNDLFILVTLLSAYHSLVGSTLLCPYLSTMDVANRLPS